MTKAAMVESVFKEQSYEFGADLKNPRVREYAELYTEDLIRKGCIPETYPGPECRGCASCVDGHCPLEDWEKRHPEFKDDELSKKVKALETELYGWHKPPTHEIKYFGKMTVAELIEKLKALPSDAETSSFEVKVKI